MIYVIYAVCGILSAAAFSFPKLWILPWVSLMPVLFLEIKRNRNVKRPKRRTYLCAMSFFYPYAVMTLYWFSELYPLEFTGMSKGAALCVVLLGMFGLSLFQAAVWSFMFVLFDIIVRAFFSSGKRDKAVLLYAPLWIVFEWLQTQTWIGVPWGKLALSQTAKLPIIQCVSLLGPYLLSGIMILCQALISRGAVKLSVNKIKEAVLPISLAVLIFTANITYGYVKMNRPKDSMPKIKVSAIQGNVSSSDKWADDSYEAVTENYRELTLEAAQEGTDIVLWPETAFPYTVTPDSVSAKFLSSLAKEAKVTILVGAFYRNADGGLENSIFQVNQDGEISESVYSKRHLVPFGEYVPYRNVIMTLVPPLNEIGMLSEDLIPGKDSALHNTEHGKVGSLICFDSIYEALCADSVRDGAELIAVSTNDSWFNDSSAVFEHNSDSVLRAVENGRYIVRAANTGVSSIITSDGEVKKMLPPLVRGQITDEVTLIQSKTLYTTVGNIIVPTSVAVVVLVCTYMMLKGRISRGHNR